MALIGTYRKVTQVLSETNFGDVEITEPDGTIRMEKYPLPEEKVETFLNSYVIVRAASLHQRMSTTGEKHLFVSALVSVYRSKNHKNLEFHNELFHDVIDFPIESLDELNNNPLAFCYEKLKTEKGYELLKDE